MKQLGLAYFTDTHWTALGLLIFFVFFIVMLVRTTMKTQKSTYAELAKLPLDGE